MKKVLMFFLMLVSANTVISQQVIFQDGFESGQFDPNFWTARPSIAGAAGGRVEVVNSNANARTGTFSAFIGRSTDGQLTTNALDLRLNLSGHTEAELRYWLQDFFDEIQQGEGLYFSDDGGQSFVQVAPFDIENETENVYLDPPPVDVDALAKANGLFLTSTFVIRFQQIGSGDFNTIGDEDGFILDDVSVTVPQIEYVSLPFEDGFETGVLRPMWHEGNPSEPAVGEVTAPGFAPSRRGGWVEVVNSPSNARMGTYSVFIGRSTDGQSTTNALNLRLNLSGQTQVELRFWMKDFFDETQQQEGLYFSDDAGQNFIQALRLDPSSRPDNQYTQQIVDVDALAASNGLSLTSTFVIRFQQIGTGDFNTIGDEDGFILDDISVIGNATTAVEENYAVPEAFTVFQNYPNPFNPSTQIFFALPSAQKVTLKVFDLAGKEVATLLQNEQKAAGTHELTFDAKNLPSGVYLYKLKAGKYTGTKKMILLR